jgi:2-C-methyl-D-erythritol 4-phosphate cytidylyltransferase
VVAADAVQEITQIVLNYPPGWREPVQEIVRSYAIATPVAYLEAGATRHESVARGLAQCSNERVIIHESARPLVSPADFRRLIDDPRPNVALMLPIPFTVAPVDPETSRVTGSLDRSRLRNGQLPQKYAAADLRAAHDWAAARGLVYTEDATLVVDAGHEVYFVPGSDRNLKVTTRTDVRLAAFLLQGGDDGRDDFSG